MINDDQKWRPVRCDVILKDGTTQILDIGPDCKIAVVITGPYTDLKLDNVKEVRVSDVN